MGKGASTSQSNVSKKLPSLATPNRASSTTGSEGAASSAETSNACLIVFKETVELDKRLTKSISAGFNFVVILDDKNNLQIVGSGQILGSYTGKNSSLLKRCIKNNYVYRGTILSIQANVADCEITGYGVSDGATTNM